MLYKVLINPHVIYYSTIFYELPNYKFQQLQTVQNKCIKFVLSCGVHVSGDNLGNVKCQNL